MNSTNNSSPKTESEQNLQMDQMSLNNNYLHQSQQHQAFNSNESRHYSNNLYSYYSAPSTDLVDTMNLDNNNNQNKEGMETVSQDNPISLAMSTFHSPTNSSMNRNSISPLASSSSTKKQKTNHDTKKPKMNNRAEPQVGTKTKEAQDEVQVNSG